MKRPLLLLAALFVLATVNLRGQGLSGNALLAFESYDLDAAQRDGWRQTYELRFDRSLAPGTAFRLRFRADQFNNSETTAEQFTESKSRQLEPTAELVINQGAFHLQGRSDYIDSKLETSTRDSNRELLRNNGQLVWTPDGLPEFGLLTQRFRAKDDLNTVDQTNDDYTAHLRYERWGVGLFLQDRYSRASDDVIGYTRTIDTRQANLVYAATAFRGKVQIAAQGDGQWLHQEQAAMPGRDPSIPTPITIPRAFYALDETPLDSTDHPLAAAPKLNDRRIDESAGYSLGPDGLSFQNFAFDLSVIQKVDEIRVIVRDELGNPLRIGGGTVLWDVYTSQDGTTWVPVTPVESSFDAGLSLYSIRFPFIFARWYKVVNFGVNVDTTNVTEVQAYFHTSLIPGGPNTRDQSNYSATGTISATPTDRILVSYTGIFSSLNQTNDSLGATATAESSATDLEHMLSALYRFRQPFTIRGQYLTRDATSFNGDDDTFNQMSGFVDWEPTRRLLTTLELTRERQNLAGTAFTIDRKAIHANGRALQSLIVGLDGGVETQDFEADATSARRTFFDMTANAQLTPGLRLLLTANLNRTVTDSSDPATQLLGPALDQRVSGDFIYRTGNELTLGARLGYARATQYSGLTQRYHVEWYPFADGTVSLGGSYDQDIDPANGREATRAIFNPRWRMNNFVLFAVEYTNVTTSYDTFSQSQTTLYATVTLSFR